MKHRVAVAVGILSSWCTYSDHVPGLEVVGYGYNILQSSPFAAFQDAGTSLEPVGSYVGWYNNGSFGPVDGLSWEYPDAVSASVIPPPHACYDPMTFVADLPAKFVSAVQSRVSIEYSFDNYTGLAKGFDAASGTASSTYQSWLPASEAADRVWLGSQMQCAKYTLALDWEAQQSVANWQLTEAFRTVVQTIPATTASGASCPPCGELLSRFGSHIVRSASFGGVSSLYIVADTTGFVSILRNSSLSAEAGLRLLHLARFGFDSATDPSLPSMQAVQALGAPYLTYRPVTPPECPTSECRDGSKWVARLQLADGLVAPVFLELRSMLDYLAPAFFPDDPSILQRYKTMLEYMLSGQACADSEGCFLPTDNGCANVLANGTLAQPCLGSATCVGGKCMCDDSAGDFFGPQCGSQVGCATNATCASWTGDEMCCRGDGLCVDAQDEATIDQVMCYMGCFGTAATCGQQQGFQCCADGLCRPQMCNSEPGGSCNATGACPALEHQMPVDLDQSIANGTLPLGEPLAADRIAANGTHVGYYRLLPSDYALPLGLRFDPTTGAVAGTPSQPTSNTTFQIMGFNANGNATSNRFWIAVEG